MQAESADGCFDVQPSLDFLNAAGVHIDPGSVRLTVVDVVSWKAAGHPGKVSGLTTFFDVTVTKAAGGWPFTHEMLHVSERPGINADHTGWSENGFFALCNIESDVDRGDLTGWGYTQPNGPGSCAPPNLPADMADGLRAAGYPVDAVVAQMAEVCTQ